MLDIIKNMIDTAGEKQDYNQMENIKDLVYILSTTFNAPSNWRDIGEELYKKYKHDNFIMENLELYNYENEE